MSKVGRIRIVVVLVLALLALLAVRLHNANGATTEQDSITAGQRLAEAWCAKCHALDAASAGTSSRAPDFVRIANRASTTELSLKVFLRSNHRSMPNLIIAPDQADNLAQFILSLKRD
jgi:cytochrome c